MKKRVLLLGMTWIILCILTGCSDKTAEIAKDADNEVVIETQSVYENKLITEYTWEEFEELSGDQQEAFFEAFGALEAFDEWMRLAKPDEISADTTVVVEKPWESNGKAISEYTWEEFEALSGDQQEAFFEAFGTSEEFDEWMHLAKPNEVSADTTVVVEKPWKNNGKAIDEYTWEEFEALSGDQQEAFFEDFENSEAFERWMIQVKPED